MTLNLRALLWFPSSWIPSKKAAISWLTKVTVHLSTSWYVYNPSDRFYSRNLKPIWSRVCLSVCLSVCIPDLYLRKEKWLFSIAMWHYSRKKGQKKERMLNSVQVYIQRFGRTRKMTQSILASRDFPICKKSVFAKVVSRSLHGSLLFCYVPYLGAVRKPPCQKRGLQSKDPKKTPPSIKVV